MVRNTFSYEQWRGIRTMGASWFISYAYHSYVDATHLNWKEVPTAYSRISVFNSTKPNHKDYLDAIMDMNEAQLGTNKIGLTGAQVKQLAKIISTKLND